MVWPFTQKRTKSPEKATLHHILTDLGLITEEQARQAYEFQISNPEIMFGEAVARLGFVDEGLIEAVIQIQRAMRSEKKSVEDFINFVNKQTEKLGNRHDDLQRTCDLHFHHRALA
jgi:hypothetical protein